MANKPEERSVASLQSHVSWTRVLPALGIHIPATVVPIQLQCPFCRGQRLLILNDLSYGGQWYSCSDCRERGNLLQLASRIWQLSMEATITKLQGLGFDLPVERTSREGVERYVKWLARQNRVMEGWVKCQATMQGPSNALGDLLRKLAVRVELTGDRYRRGPGPLLGGVWRDDAERMFQDYTPQQRKPNSQNKPNHSVARLLKGPKWQHCLVTPYWDVPGRIAGLTFIGREGRRDQGDFVYKNVVSVVRPGINQQSSAPWVDAGLAMHPELYYAPKASPVVCIDDPLLMLKLQLRNFRTETQPLPLATWHHALPFTTTHSWKLLAGRPLVFWSQEITPALLWHVVQQDGLISQSGPDKPGAQARTTWLLARTTPKLLQQVINEAKPWQEVLSGYFETAATHEIEEIFHTLRLWGMATDVLLQACEPDVRTRVVGLLGKDTPSRCLSVNRRIVVEKEDGWYDSVRGDLSLIVDGVLEIDRVVHQLQQKRTLYQGRIRYHGRILDFCERQEVVEKDTCRWMQRKLLDAGYGLLRFSPTWNKHVVTIANQIKQPEFVQAVDVVGWNVDTSHFVFPRFAISADGAAQPLTMELIAPDTPAIHLTPPTTFSPIEAAALTPEHRGAAVAWSLILTTLADALSPVFSRVPGSVALAGVGVVHAAQGLQRTLGWYAQPFDFKTQPNVHRWPILLHTGDKPDSAAKNWLRLADRRSYVAELSWLQAALLYVQGGWTMVEHEAAVDVPPAFTRTESLGIITNYLADLASRHFQFWRQSPNFGDDICEDVAEWIGRCGGNAAVIRDAGRLVTYESNEERADTFGDVIARFHLDGKMATAREGHLAPRGKLCSVIMDSGDLFIPKESLIMLARKAILLDGNHVSQLLAEAGRLNGEAEYDDRSGWLVDMEWWTERMKRWRTTGLKLHEG